MYICIGLLCLFLPWVFLLPWSLIYTAIKELPPSSIECLTALTLLDLSGCENLECLLSNMDSLRSLEELIISRCSKLANLPENLWKLKCLKKLYLSGMSRLEAMGLTGISCLSSLKYLALVDNSFVTLPTSISQLSKLEALDLCHWNNLQTLLELPSTVRYIYIYIYAQKCYSIELSLAQSSLSRPCSYSRQYNESIDRVAFTLLNRYLQVIYSLFPLLINKVSWSFFFFFFGTGTPLSKQGIWNFYQKEEDRSGIEFHICLPRYEILRWFTHQRSFTDQWS